MPASTTECAPGAVSFEDGAAIGSSLLAGGGSGPRFLAESQCASCGSQLSTSLSSLGSSLRCASCRSVSRELCSDSVSDVFVSHARWDVSRQELLPTTLADDRLPTGRGLARFRFEPYEVASDALASAHFVTAFDAYEVATLVTRVAAVAPLPGDVLEMAETVFGDDDEEEAGIAAAETETIANAPEGEGTPSVVATSAAPVSQKVAGGDSDLSHRTGAALLRTVSAFLKSTKEQPAPPGADASPSAAAPSVSRAATLDTRASSSGVAFQTVKEETLSDMEVASDISRGASGTGGAVTSTIAPSSSSGSAVFVAPVIAAPSVLESRASSSTSAGMPSLVPLPTPAPATSASPVLPLAAVKEEAQSLTAPLDEDATAAAALTIEQEFSGFLGLDSLGDGGDTSFFSSFGEPDADAVPGLQSALSTYLSGAHMSVETESASALHVRSFSLARSFSHQLGAALDEFGGAPATTSAVEPTAPLKESSTLMRAPSALFGSLSRQGSLAGSFTGSFAEHTAPTRTATTVFPPTASPSHSQTLFSQPSFTSMSPPPLHPQVPQHHRRPTRLPSVLGMGVSPSGSFGGFPQSQQQQVGAFNSVAQRFPSIFEQGVLAAAFFQRVYNEEARARAARSSQSAAVASPQGPSGFVPQWDTSLMSPSSHANAGGAGAQLEFGGGVLSSSPSIGGGYGLNGLGGSQSSNPPSLPPFDGSGSQSLGLGLSGSQDLGDFDTPLVGSFDAGASRGVSDFGMMPPPPPPHQQHQHTDQTTPSPSPPATTPSVIRLAPEAHFASASPPIVAPAPPPQLMDATTAATLSGISSRANVPSLSVTLSALSRILDLSNALLEPLTEFARLLAVDETTAKLAAHICAQTQQRGLASTRQNSSVSAAALYMALTMENKKPTQNDFCRKINLTEVTLRKVQNELVGQWGLLIPASYKPKVVPSAWPPRAMPPPPPVVHSARPTRSASSTIHAVHGDWKKAAASAASSPPPTAATPSATTTTTTMLTSRAPSFLYAPPAVPVPTQTRRELFSPRTSGVLPPGFVAVTFAAPAAATPATNQAPLRFCAPVALTLEGQSIVVSRSAAASGDAVMTDKDEPMSPRHKKQATFATRPSPEHVMTTAITQAQ